MDQPVSASPASMTGFSRWQGAVGAVSYVWEMRSVNAKALDVRLRLPGGLDRLEGPVREAVKNTFGRGSVNIALAVERAESKPRYRLNEALVADLIGLARQIEAAGAPAQRLDALLSVKGVLEVEEEGADLPDEAAMDAALMAGFTQALRQLAQARAQEGEKLGPILADQLAHIEALVAQARGLAAAQPGAIRDRLQEQLSTLLAERSGIGEERLAQEVAILAGKADIREELDRLDAHIAQARDLLVAGDPIGRRLDFLCQEFNREANTLCSKSADLALTRIGLDLKATIERFREQIQNIE